MEYKQYIVKHESEIGTIKLEYTYERRVNTEEFRLDDLYITVNGRAIMVPKSWITQTQRTLIAKLCAMFKAAA